VTNSKQKPGKTALHCFPVPEKRFHLRHFDVPQGAPAGVSSIRHESSGTLLVGSRTEGLFRFDGSVFTPLKRPFSATTDDDKIHAITGDPVTGNVWIATRHGMIFFTSASTSLLTPCIGMPSLNISACAYDRQNRILWGGTSHGLFFANDNGAQGSLNKFTLGNTVITAILPDGPGKVWSGTGNGLYYFSDDTSRVYTFKDGLPVNSITTLFKDSHGCIWVGTTAGLCFLENETGNVIKIENRIPRTLISSVFEDLAGRIWIGSFSGVFILENNNLLTLGEDDGLLSPFVSDIAQDQDQGIWLSYAYSGLSRVSVDTTLLLSHRIVGETMAQDSRGGLWFGSEERVFLRQQESEKTVVFGSKIHALVVGKKDSIWVGTFADGIYYFTGEATFFKGEICGHYTRQNGLESDSILSLLQSRDGTIYAGTRNPGSLAVYSHGKWKSIHIPLKTVGRLYEDSSGRIWLGGFWEDGLGCLEKGKLRIYTEKDGLSNTAILSIVEDKDNILWVGTHAGVFFMDKDKFVPWGPVAGFRSTNHQCSGRAQDGTLWFGTKNGLYCTDRHHLQRLTINEGLPGSGITGIIPQKDNSLVISTYHGIIHYKNRPLSPPLVKIESVTTDRTWDSPSEIQILMTREIRFRFRGIHLGTSTMYYSYTLDGHETEWHDTFENEVTYCGIPEGNYIFRVTAVNTDLSVSEKPALVKITILPVPALRKAAEEDLEEYRRQLEIMVEERTALLSKALEDLKDTQEQLLLSEKLAALGQLVSGIAHEINSPLSAIRSSVQNIARMLDQTVRSLPFFFKVLSPTDLDFFKLLVDKAVGCEQRPSSREERTIRKDITAFLVQRSIPDAESVAETFVGMRIYDGIEQFLPLFNSEECRRILHMADKVSSFYRSSEIITTATTRASNVILALKQYMRSDTPTMRLSSDIVDGIETVLTLYHNQIQYDIEVVREYKKRPVIPCFPEDLIHVWMNLIHNAIYAMPGEGMLSLFVDEKDGNVIVTISDTGSGIPKEIQSKIFDPFFTTKPRGEGTGLGLDIVRKIVEKHDGRITLSSVPGKTEFTVILPVVDAGGNP